MAVQKYINNLTAQVWIPSITYQGPEGHIWVRAQVSAGGAGAPLLSASQQNPSGLVQIPVPNCPTPTNVQVNAVVQLFLSVGLVPYLRPTGADGLLVFFSQDQQTIIGQKLSPLVYNLIAPVNIPAPPPPPTFVPPPVPVYLPPPQPYPSPGPPPPPSVQSATILSAALS